MLHCNMDTITVQLCLDDLVADLRHARRTNDLGRLALVAYCEVRRWARSAGEPVLANRVAQMVLESPQPSREAFLAEVDALIDTLELLQARGMARPPSFPLASGHR
jgi:hypothetical protein